MSEETKKCPYCAEEIKAEAIVCKHCKRDLPDAHSQIKGEQKTDPNDGGCLVAIGIIIVVALVAFLAIIFGGNGSSSSSSRPRPTWTAPTRTRATPSPDPLESISASNRRNAWEYCAMEVRRVMARSETSDFGRYSEDDVSIFDNGFYIVTGNVRAENMSGEMGEDGDDFSCRVRNRNGHWQLRELEFPEYPGVEPEPSRPIILSTPSN